MNNLKKIREEKGLTQIELAAKAGVSTATLYFIENNKANKPNKSTLKAIASALNCKVSDLQGE